MDTENPRSRELFFEVHSGLPREAPGSEACTLEALGRVPALPARPLVLDLGSGPGAATTVLARETSGHVVALDLHRPFLTDLVRRARDAHLETRVSAVHGRMESPPFPPARFDLVWSEGALYSIGFGEGLEVGHRLLKQGGHLVATEAVWREAEPPEEVRRWWEGEYPALTTVEANLRLIQAAGFSTLDHFTLPEDAWWEYYRPLEARLQEVRRRHHDEPALGVLDEAQVEVDMFRRHGRSYGYELFVCRKP
jgi:SAM-dependent methyltransferase